MSRQGKRHGVMTRIRTSDLTIERPTLYHLSYPARHDGGDDDDGDDGDEDGDDDDDGDDGDDDGGDDDYNKMVVEDVLV
jgi:hypothetical protein